MKKLLLAVCAVGLIRTAIGQTQLILDGGFELPSVSWNIAGSGATIGSTKNFAHTGTHYLTMGNFAGADQGAYQLIAIPTNAVDAMLTFYWEVISTNGSAQAELDAYVVDGTLNPLTNVILQPVSGALGIYGYYETVYDLSAYLGQTIGIYFRAQTDSTYGSAVSFNIDDVSVLYITAAQLPPNDYFTNRIVLSGTSNTVFGTNAFASKEPGEPKHAGNSGGRSLWWAWTPQSNGVATVTTAGSTFNTLLAVYTGSDVRTLVPVKSNSNGTGSNVKFNAIAGTQYQIAVDGVNGLFGTIELKLAFQPDTTKPGVGFSSPGAGAKVNTSSITVAGTASDNIAVALVEFRLENANGTNDWQPAGGTTKWTAIVTNLIPGMNTVRVRATDTSGNVSTTVARAFQFVVLSPFNLMVNGAGTVAPDLNGQSLQVGSSYTVTARANTGYLFTGWTGGVVANAPKLTFVMVSNMTLQAGFIPNPFIPVQGAYAGLFYDTNAVAHQSSGSINLTLASGGSFTANGFIAGQSYSLSGQFSTSGSAVANAVWKGPDSVSAQLQLDFNGGITGLFSDGHWTAELVANRDGFASTNHTSLAGNYTWIIPGGGPNSASGPGGDGCGTMKVDSLGNVTFSGMLGDGSIVTPKAVLSSAGQVPFYASLYSGNGSILGWLAVSNSVIGGQVNWFKLPQPAAKLYPAGFTNWAEAVGSIYNYAKTVPVLSFSNGIGQVWFAGGNLAGSFTNQVGMAANSVVTNRSANNLTLTITTSSGLFKGTVTDPAGGAAIPFNGAVLQQQNIGGGMFTGTNQTGQVYFGP